MLKFIFRTFLSMVAFSGAFLFSAAAQAETSPSLDQLAFLEGHWRGGEDFIFEETWSSAEGGVMTAMARGVSSGELKVLEYIVTAQEGDAVIMRFKHFRHDYSTWEDGGPVVLTLTASAEDDVTFTADPPSETVKSVRYWMTDADTLQADIVLIEDGEEGGFSLIFNRIE